MTNRFQPLNDAIGRAGGDGKSCSHGFDRLVVGTVHTQLASPDQRGQPAARRHLDRMDHHAQGATSDGAVGEGVGDLSGNVLNECPPSRDVEHLGPPADGQQG